VVSVHFNKTLFLGSKGSHGKKKMMKKKKTTWPFLWSSQSESFCQSTKTLSALQGNAFTHIVQSEFLNTWCENGLSLSMKALIMHWIFRRSCKVTAPEQCSQISHNRFIHQK